MLPLASLLDRGEGLVCLSGCAGDGALAETRELGGARRGARRWRGGCSAPSGANAFGSSCSVRSGAATGAQPLARRARGAARRRLRRDRQRPRPRPPPGRASRTPWSPCAGTRRSRRPSRGGAATASSVLAAPGGDGGPLRRASARRWPRPRGSAERLELRSDPRPRLPLPRLGGSRRRPRAGRDLPRPGSSSATAASPSTPRPSGAWRTSSQVIRKLGLSGFLLLHFDMLELAREVAAEVRGPDSARSLLPPGRGRGSSVSSIVCYLTGLSHVDPVRNGLFLGRFLNEEITRGAGHRPRLPAGHPREADPARARALRDAIARRWWRRFACYRSRGAVRDFGKALGLPAGEIERVARTVDDVRPAPTTVERDMADGDRRGAGRRRRAGGRSPELGPRGMGAAAPRLPAPRRDGDLDPAADRHLPGAAGRDGGAPARPVGQGLVRGRRLPEDRPAGAGDALGGRALRRRDRRARAASGSTSRGSRWTTRRPSGRSGRPTPPACSRSRAGRRCRCCPAPARRPSTT